jgi:hypothetical protein
MVRWVGQLANNLSPLLSVLRLILVVRVIAVVQKTVLLLLLALPRPICVKLPQPLILLSPLMLGIIHHLYRLLGLLIVPQLDSLANNIVSVAVLLLIYSYVPLLVKPL